MASSRKTLDVDLITLRNVYVRGNKNTFLPSSSVLMSDGVGGTYWALLSTVGTYPSFQQINIDSNSYSATPITQTFSFLTGNGIGFADAGPGSNASYLYAKAFQTIAVPGLSSLTAFTSNRLTPTLTLSSLGGLQLSTDTVHQVVYFNAGIKNFNVLSNTSTFTSNLTGPTLATFQMTPMLSTLTFMGVGDITLTTTPANTVFVGIQGFTSAGYQALSGEVFSLQSSILTTASTVFVDKSYFYSTISTFSSIVGNQISSYAISSTYLSLSTFSMSNISTYSTLYSSLSTSISFNISTLSSYFYAVNQSTLSSFVYNKLASTIVGYSSFFSTIMFNNITNGVCTISTYTYLTSTNASSISTLINLLTSTTWSTFAMTSTMLISTLQATATGLSTMSTTMTSSFLSLFTPRINLVSSFTYIGARGDGVRMQNIPQTILSYPTGGMLFSTAYFTFSNITPIMTTTNPIITIDYNPSILFPMATSLSNAFSTQVISTYIAYQPTNLAVTSADNYFPVVGTTYTDTLMLNNYNPGYNNITSNLYSKYIRLTLDAIYVKTNPTGKYVIYHYLPNAYGIFINPNIAPQINSTVHIRTSVENSLFLTLFNIS